HDPTTVLDHNNPAIQAFIQAAVAHQQATEIAAAAAAAALASANNVMDHARGVTHPAVAAAVAQLANAVPGLQKLLAQGISISPGPVSASAAVSASVPAPAPATTTASAAVTVAPASIATPAPVPVSASSAATLSASPVAVAPVPVSAAPTVTTRVSTPAAVESITSTVKSVAAPPPPAAAAAPSSSSSTSSSSTSSIARSFVTTKRFNPDDIFCLGCCRNLSVDHYTCPNTNRIFKSCNACRHKSRINSKKVTRPATVPTKPTISMDEFSTKLKDLEETQEESNLDVMVRLEGSVEMDPDTLKARGSEIAAKVYEATGYWFSHSRTNDETQSKTRLKIYGCSQREDRRAPPAPKTQSRKRNRPSTKAYFPCKGNLTMTFYHNMNHVRVVYNHSRHAKYDNRKCPDHVRAFVKENLGLAPRQLFDTLLEQNPSLSITQAQVRYWSHYYKKNMDQDGDLSDGVMKSDGVPDSSS
ncbi:hypothetical protein BGZ65_011011, partial [Modicella reniformis]